MTVLSAGIVNKQGRIILARQFVDVSRTRIESLLSAFPRLLETAVNSQVTFIDADTVRYVYQPLEEFYLVLVTTTTSNIVEDLATLQLMRRLISDHVAHEELDGDGGAVTGALTEELLEQNVFHVFMAFDEVIVAGKREETELQHIQTYLAMDSAEERSAQELKRAQVEKARRVTAERARELRERRRATMLHDGEGGSGSGSGSGGGMYEGIGSSDVLRVGGGGSRYAGSEDHVVTRSSRYSEGGGGSMGGGGGAAGDGRAAAYSSYYAARANHGEEKRADVVMRAAAPRSTMTLGKANKTGLTRRVQEEMGITNIHTDANAHTKLNTNDEGRHVSAGGGVNENRSSTGDAAAVVPSRDDESSCASAAAAAAAGVHIVVDERITAVLPRDGEAAETDIKGELSIRVTDPALDRVVLALAPVSADFVFRAHAKVDKALFARESVLAMLEDRPLPLQQAVTVLRWRLSRPGSIQPPITFSCWPEVGSLTVDYELVNHAVPPLTQVQLVIPVRGGVGLVRSSEASVGECGVRRRQGGSEEVLVWSIDEVSATRNVSGHVEITLSGNEDASGVFFPIDVSFTSHVSVGLVHVNEVISTALKTPVRFSQEARLVTDHLRIE